MKKFEAGAPILQHFDFVAHDEQEVLPKGSAAVYTRRFSTLIAKDGRSQLKVFEDDMRELLVSAEAYIHAMPQVKTVRELLNRIVAGLRVHPDLMQSPLSLDEVEQLTEHMNGKAFQDFRPEDVRWGTFTTVRGPLGAKRIARDTDEILQRLRPEKSGLMDYPTRRKPGSNGPSSSPEEPS